MDKSLLELVIGAKDKTGRAFDAVKKRIDSTRKASKKFSAGLAKDWEKNKGAIMGGAAAVGYFAYKALEAGSKFEETQSKFNVVFRGMEEEATNWADSFAENMGKSKQQVYEMAAGTADIIKPMGFATKEAFGLSRAMAGLALDVASFNDRQDTDVIKAFQSALTGERESLKSLGISISEADIKQEALRLGLHKGTGEMTKQSKALTTMNLLYENSSDAQGDLGRTAESYANQMKFLKSRVDDFMVSFGQKLMPAVLKFVQQVGPTMEAVMGDVSSSTDKASKSTGWFGKTFAVVVEGLMSGIKVIKFAFQTVAKIVGTAIAIATEGVMAPIRMLKKVAKGDFEGAIKVAENATENFKNGISSMSEDISADFMEMGNGISLSVKRIEEVFDEASQSKKAAAASAKRKKYAENELKANKANLAGMIESYKGGGKASAAAAKKTQKAFEKMRTTAEKNITKIKENISSLKEKLLDLSESYKKSIGGLDSSLGEKFVEQEQKIKDLRKNIKTETDSTEKSALEKQLKREEKALEAFKEKFVTENEEIKKKQAEISNLEAGLGRMSAFKEYEADRAAAQAVIDEKKAALDEYRQTVNSLDDEIAETKRKNSLTDLERFVEDATLKRTELQKDFEEKAIKLNEELTQKEEILEKEKKILEDKKVAVNGFKDLHNKAMDSVQKKATQTAKNSEQMASRIVAAMSTIKSVTAPEEGPDNRSLRDVASQHGITNGFGGNIFSSGGSLERPTSNNSSNTTNNSRQEINVNLGGVTVQNQSDIDRIVSQITEQLSYKLKYG